MAAQEIPLLPRASQSPDNLVLGNKASLDVIDPFVGREGSPRRHKRSPSPASVCCILFLILLVTSYLCASGLWMQTSSRSSILTPFGIIATHLGFPALVGLVMSALSTCSLLAFALWYAWQKGDHKTHLDPYIHGPLILGADMGSLPDRGGGCYMWVRTQNGFEERALRRRAAHQTLAACRDNGYRIECTGAGSNFSVRQHVKLDFVQEMINQTAFVRAQSRVEVDGLAPLNVPSVKLVKGNALDIAVECSQSGERVVVVNAASAYHPGGGFHNGGRHALEESMCIQTTLFASLEHAYQLRPESLAPCRERTSDSVLEPYIPPDQVILSPDVEVFRGATADGYPFLRQKVNLSAVVSVAMPNRNPEVRNIPVDKPSSSEEYEALLRLKYKAVLCAAVSVPQAEVLVMPCVGGGVFKNDPKVLGAAFGEALRSFPCTFKKVLVADQGAFGHAVCCALERELA